MAAATLTDRHGSMFDVDDYSSGQNPYDGRLFGAGWKNSAT
ncbi:MAG TPA: hypothetical protein VF375_02350 [Candidatus Limnocylindrales bacterium]